MTRVYSSLAVIDSVGGRFVLREKLAAPSVYDLQALTGAVMNDVRTCVYIRTPNGRCAGVFATVRSDDLGAVPVWALMARNPGFD